MNVQPFSPAATVTISATSASAASAIDANCEVCRVYNAGSVAAFIRFTTGASTAVITDMPIAPGAVELFSKGRADTVSAILASGTATLYFTCGEGQ